MQRKGLIILLLLLTLAPTILAKSGSKKKLFSLAESFYKAGNFKEAAKAYRRFIKNYPSSNYAPQALFHLGCTYKSLGKIDEAKASFDQLIKRYPKSSFVNYAYYEQAVLAYESKKLDETIKLLRKALDNCKDKKLAIKICFFLGNCYLDLNNYLAARGFYNEALANDLAKEYLRKRPKTYLRLAELYFTYGDFEKAANAYLEIYRIYNKKPFAASALVKAADALFRCGKYTQAIETYAQVLKHYPYSEEFWISRFHLADIGESVPNLDIPSTPIYKDYWNPIETYQEITRIPMLELAELAYLRIGSVFLKKGNYRKAVETFRDFLSTHPTSKFVQDAIDLLQDALSPIIDGFYKEKNYLDIVKIYEKNRLYLKKISNISLATKIADSYYYLGFYERALSIYKNFSLSAKNIIKVADIY
ncbi:MAG: tetratricopeptide repeat protein, partial [Deltaproteobacteria bacterium]|nr:tetratricopeptide repeat protein [Deltaproteobacteria bacterium]